MRSLSKIIRLSIQAIGLSLAMMACNLISDQAPAGEESGAGQTILIPAARGGTATSADGKLTLEFPSGALEDDTEISITAVSLDQLPDNAREGIEVGPVYRLEPEGLILKQSAAVTMELSSKDVPELLANDEEGVPVYLLFSKDDEGVSEPLEELETTSDPTNGTVQLRGNLSHFSWVYRGTPGLQIGLEQIEPATQSLGVEFTVEGVAIVSGDEQVSFKVSLQTSDNLVENGYRHEDQALGFFMSDAGNTMITSNAATLVCARVGEAEYLLEADGLGSEIVDPLEFTMIVRAVVLCQSLAATPTPTDTPYPTEAPTDTPTPTQTPSPTDTPQPEALEVPDSAIPDLSGDHFSCADGNPVEGGPAYLDLEELEVSLMAIHFPSSGGIAEITYSGGCEGQQYDPRSLRVTISTVGAPGAADQICYGVDGYSPKGPDMQHSDTWFLYDKGNAFSAEACRAGDQLFLTQFDTTSEGRWQPRGEYQFEACAEENEVTFILPPETTKMFSSFFVSVTDFEICDEVGLGPDGLPGVTVPLEEWIRIYEAGLTETPTPSP